MIKVLKVSGGLRVIYVSVTTRDVSNVEEEIAECKIQDVRQQRSSKFPGDLFYEETTSQSVGLNSASKTRTRPLLGSWGGLS